VLAGVDAASTYCYLLVAAEHRDADTWGVHLLDASSQGLKPRPYNRRCGAGLARRAEGRLGRDAAVPWRCVSHPTSVRRPRQHAIAPRQGCPVTPPEAGGQNRPHRPACPRR
jgi:hypothetical protein